MDLNADVGEGFGAYTIGADSELMPLITSVNIACGFHAGDPQVMARTVSLALAHGVTIGAHPGFPDLIGFGRRALDASEEEIENLVLYQIGALNALARAQGASLKHVKAHGALYNLAAVRLDVARAIARAVARFDPNLILVGLANSALIQAAGEVGLRAGREAFCDRAYNADGTLRSRRDVGAVFDAPERAAEQAVQLAREHTVTPYQGKPLALEPDTLCIHGDTPRAAEIARAVRAALALAGIEIKPL